jgi:solute carrier family 25 carnitine/acylcarnitine transporter 20/29
MQGVTSPLAGQMFFRASLFGAFGESKRWLGKNADGSSRALTTADFYKAGAITGFIAAFTEGPIDFYKSQIQVQIIKSKVDPAYTREWRGGQQQRPAQRACVTTCHVQC